MGDIHETAPNRSHASSALDGTELVWARDFLRYWQQFGLAERQTFVELILWCADLKQSMAKAEKAESTKRSNRRWLIGTAIAAALLLFEGGNYYLNYQSTQAAVQAARAAAPPQKVIVQFPNGQQVVVTPQPSLTPTPTTGVPEP